MKAFLIVSGLLLCAGGSLAQSGELVNTVPVWTISKQVQHLQFRDYTYKSSRVFTGGYVMPSKDIAAHHNALTPIKRVRTTGTPPHVVSKGVARLQYKRD